MSNVNTTLYNHAYYQLPADGANAAAAQSQSASAAISAQAVTQARTSLGSAYLLDLSADAQKYLSGLSSSRNSESYVLSKDQQQTLNFILEEYKTVPLNQANYVKLQDDLREAGLSPEQLSAREKINNFSPTQVFIDALNGKEPQAEDLGSSQSNEDRRANQYMSKIVQSWQKATTGAFSDAVTG